MVHPNAGTPVEHCQHKQVTHRHGTVAAYGKCKCRCQACRDAANAWKRRRKALVLAGQWDAMVDVSLAREHVQRINSEGMSRMAIAATSGVPPSVVSVVLHPNSAGNGSRIREDNAQALLAVRHRDVSRVPGNLLVSATGTRRRIQALARVRWRVCDLAVRFGVSDRAVWAWTSRRCVEARVALMVRAAYVDMVGRLGPSRVAERRAEAAGWPAPWQWDGVDIDDPRAVPLPDGASMPSLSAAEEKISRLEDLVVTRRPSWGEAAGALGVSEQTVLRWIQVSDRADLAAALTRSTRARRGEDVAC